MSAEPLWLDLQLAGRLWQRYGPPPSASDQAARALLRSRLRLWQWEHLLLTLEAAVSRSSHYPKLITRSEAGRAVAQAATEAGLGPDFLSLTAAAQSPDEERLNQALKALTARLPFSKASDIEAAPESFLAVSHDEVSGLISVSSSGTSGRGKRIFCSEDDLDRTVDFFQHGMQYLAGPGRAGRVALLMSGKRPGSVGDLLRRALQALDVACFVPGFMLPGQAGEEAMMDSLLKLEPDCLVGVPGQLLTLARHKRAPALARSVRSVLLSGDTVTPALRAGIAKGLDCEVFVHYGLTETGLGGAVECRERAGPHLREADLLAEIVDEGGAALPPGQWGEVVLTTLTRRAMPLLRYRTGDEGCLETRPCVCGSLFARLMVRGRLGAGIELQNGASLTLADLDNRLYGLPFVRGYRAVLHREAGRPPCLVLGLRLEQAPDDALQRAAQCLADLPGIAPRPDWPGYAGRDWAEAAPGGGALTLLLRRDESAPPPASLADSQAKRRFEHSTSGPGAA